MAYFAYFTCLAYSCTWCALCARVLGMLECFMNLACLRAWPTSQNGVLDVLHKMGCLACFRRKRTGRALKNGVLGVLKILKLHSKLCLTKRLLWTVDSKCAMMYSMDGRKREGSFALFIKLYHQFEQYCGEIYVKLKPRWKLSLILGDRK